MWLFSSKKSALTGRTGTWRSLEPATPTISGNWEFKNVASSPFQATDPNEAFKLPAANQSLDEMMDKHRAGPFDYVTVTSTTLFSKKELNNILISKMGKAKTISYELSDFPVVHLKGEAMELNAGQAIKASAAAKFLADHRRKAGKMTNVELKEETHNSMLPYITLNSILYHFDPTDSFAGDMSFVKVTIMDNRRNTPVSIRSVIHNSNISFSAMFSLDHSIHKDDLEHIILKIENPKNQFRSEIVWGSASIDMVIVESDRSVTTDLLPITGTHRIGMSFLSKHKRNPRFFDASLKESGRRTLHQMSKSGQIIDRTRTNQIVDFSKAAGSGADSVDIDERNRDEEFSPFPTAGPSLSTAHYVTQNHAPAIDPNTIPPSPRREDHYQPLPPLDPTHFPPNQPQPSQDPPKSPRPTRRVRVLSPSSPYPESRLPLSSHSPSPVPEPVQLPEAVIANQQLIQNSNLGTAEQPAQVFVGAKNPHVAAVALPSHSALFEASKPTFY